MSLQLTPPTFHCSQDGPHSSPSPGLRRCSSLSGTHFPLSPLPPSSLTGTHLPLKTHIRHCLPCEAFPNSRRAAPSWGPPPIPLLSALCSGLSFQHVPWPSVSLPSWFFIKFDSSVGSGGKEAGWVDSESQTSPSFFFLSFCGPHTHPRLAREGR